MKERLSFLVGMMVACVWSVTVFGGLLTHDYTSLKYVTPIMTILGGWLFGVEIVRRKKDEK